MKILHIGLASHFTEGMTYQDNQLSYQNIIDGHEVLYISDTEKYENGKLLDVGHENVTLNNGVRLVRLPYQMILGRFVSRKIRKVSRLYELIKDFRPDVILSHDLSYYSILDVIHYKKEHPQVILYADTHTAEFNSGRNWISLNILHRIFYRYLVQKALPYLEKYFYVGESEKEFSKKVYGVPELMMEYYPLGGFLFAEKEYMKNRLEKRAELAIDSDCILYIHSGKLEREKRTRELLEAFSSVPNEKSRLLIIGSIPDYQYNVLMPLIEADKRILYLGWKSGPELRKYLCACDVYCQPGSVSATLQNAICQYCAIMAYPHEAYTARLDYGNIFWVTSKEDMIRMFNKIKDYPEILEGMKTASMKCAKELLDYKQLAARLYK